MAMPRPLPLPLLLAAALAGCGGHGATHAPTPAPGPAASAAAPASVARPLAALLGQRLVVAPVAGLREGDPLGWAARIPRPSEWLRGLDDEIAFALRERGVAGWWVFPEQLERSWRGNANLSADPYALAVDPLRRPRLDVGTRLPEPLASQLRTLVAVHDARLALMPVELAFDAAGGGTGRGVLRLVLADARSSEVRWAGHVKSDSSATLDRSLRASLAARVADLVAAP